MGTDLWSVQVVHFIIIIVCWNHLRFSSARNEIRKAFTFYSLLSGQIGVLPLPEVFFSPPTSTCSEEGLTQILLCALALPTDS
jgi:hypothetical protein